MRALFSYITLLISYMVYSQQYVPLPLQNCYWQIKDAVICSYNTSPSNSSSLTYNLYPTGNVVIAQKSYVEFSKLDVLNNNNTSCAYLSQPGNGYQCAIRQDTLNKLVYIKYSTDTIEKILYNFNYVKGDSVKTVLGDIATPNGNIYRVVDSVYFQTYTDGIARKTYILKPMSVTGIQLNDYIIEGIGNETGLLNIRKQLSYSQPKVYIVNESWRSFLVINNDTVFKTPINTYYNSLMINEQIAKQNIHIYPIPCDNILKISSYIFNSESNYEIIDITGKIILYGSLNNNTNNIDISSIEHGVYFLKINMENITLNYKIIKE